jgi:phage terminase large subunit GpA-like protein
MYSPRYHDSFSIREQLAEFVRPPMRITVAEAANKYVKVALPGGWDYWDPSITPYMVKPMNLLASRLYEAVIFCGPSRSGKTAALLDCWNGYAAKCNSGDMNIYFPVENDALDYGKRTTRRMHENSPELGALLSARGSDNNISTVIYRNGMILKLSYPTSGNFSRVTLKYVALTEYDSFPDNVDGEGEPFILAKKRVQNAMSAGMVCVESSPKRVRVEPGWIPDINKPHEAPPVQGGILSLYNRGDRQRWYWKCQHCSERFEAPPLPDFDNHEDVDTAAKTARVICPHCGAIHFQGNRRDLNLEGMWLTEREYLGAGGDLSVRSHNPLASFWLLGCAAAFQTWPSLVANELRALREFERLGSEEALKATRNTDQALPYLPEAAKVKRDPSKYRERLEPMDRNMVPEGVRFLLSTVDVQSRKFVAQVHGIGVGNEKWIIDRFDVQISDRIAANGEPEIIDPSVYDEDWLLLLSKVFGKRYPLADGSGRLMPVYAMGTDSGGRAGVSSRAYNFWRHCRKEYLGNRILLLKGDSNTNDKTPTIRETFPDSDRKGKWQGARGEVPVYLINTYKVKNLVDGDLKKGPVEPGCRNPGFVHIPAWGGDEFLKELMSEQLTPKGWAKIQANIRNEAWDLLCYAQALCHHFGTHNWGNNWEMAPDWAKNWDNNSTIISPNGGASNAGKSKLFIPI